MGIETTGPDAGRAEDSAPDLNRDITDAFTTLMKRAGTIGHSIAGRFGIAPPDLLAMFKLDDALPMKELAQRMGCDASFITAVADTLEKRGYLRREPGERDRRVKNLVLTPEGMAAKERLFAHFTAKMPWNYALDDTERQCLLTLIRKMLDATPPQDAGDAGHAGEGAHAAGASTTAHPWAPGSPGE